MLHKHLSDKYGLPESIKVKVKKTGNILYAKLPEYPGCMTMAEDSLDLVIKVNDVLLTYFQVPRAEAKQCSFFYFPEMKKVEKIKAYPQGVDVSQQFNSYARCYA